MAARRRIHKAKVRFVSLVPRGANQLVTMYKSENEGADLHLETLVQKYDAEQGELTAAVYIPEVADSQGDIASAKVIKEMLYDAAKDGFGIDIRHNNVPIEAKAAFVAERFIIQKNDPRFTGLKNYKGEKVDPTGGWGVVVKIADESLREKYRTGEFKGVSMEGPALVEMLKSQTEVEEELDEPGELDMDAAELKKTLEDNNKAMLALMQKGIDDSLDARGVKKAEVKKSSTAEEPVEDDAPKLEPGATVVEIKKHGLLLKRHKLVKSLNVDDGAKYDKAITEIEKIDKDIEALEKPADDKGGKGKINPKIAELEKELDSLRGRSRQPVKKGEDEDGEEQPAESFGIQGLEKSDEDDPAELGRLGREMAQSSNKTRGLSAA